MSTINNNLMAANVANTLNAHYGRLATSVQRLSSGLRINSSADDAAGLAIRELMRADVAALNQGARNANDAISMLQVADGALAIIDEKLIRMKELAEQAATGTYNSTQRLIIDSEYQAMAAEIDRIARATDFNGIKLLDGSLAGEHDGSGLKVSGKMKIHFGSGNDSAEDYYYVEIGDCTAAALGVGAGATQSGQQITYIKVEKQELAQATFTMPDKIDVFVGPDGNEYYKVGDIYCQYADDPYRYQITDEGFIAQLVRKQHEIRTTTIYNCYQDPNTGVEYYLGNGSYTSDAYDPVGKRLDAANPDHDAIIKRLVKSPGNKTVEVDINWKVWSDPHGKRYYSYDNGNTFVPDPSKPSTGVLDKGNAADAAIINDFEVVLGEYAPELPAVDVEYKEWQDPQTKKMYYSKDGVTFVSDMDDPLSAVTDQAVLKRLEISLAYTFSNLKYNTYRHPRTGELYYTADNVTWQTSPGNPLSVSLNINDSADALVIAALQPYQANVTYRMTCAVYQDTANNNKLYYSWDNGRTYFSDIADPGGSSFIADDPAYAGLVANFNKISSTVSIDQAFVTYYDEVSLTKYYSSNGGKTFYLDPEDPASFVDPAIGNNAIILGSLKIYPSEQSFSTLFYRYTDPVTDKTYYSPDNKNTFYAGSDLKTPILSASNSNDKDIIDRLQGYQRVVKHTGSADAFPQLTVYTYNGRYYYSADGGKTFAKYASDPYRNLLNPNYAPDKNILDSLKPHMVTKTTIEYIKQVTGDGVIAGDGASISTQAAAQKALTAIDRAIVSKDKIRAHLGALQNRLENTVTNLSIQSENLKAAESRISDADIALEMTNFVRNQILTQSSVAMLGQANSYPHMLLQLLNR